MLYGRCALDVGQDRLFEDEVTFTTVRAQGGVGAGELVEEFLPGERGIILWR